MSLENRSWISLIFGCSELMARICFNCFRVMGIVSSRIKAVSVMIARPIWLNNMV